MCLVVSSFNIDVLSCTSKSDSPYVPVALNMDNELQTCKLSIMKDAKNDCGIINVYALEVEFKIVRTNMEIHQ